MSRITRAPIDTLITPPAAAAMSVSYASLHIRALTTDDNALITAWIAAATQYFESYTGRQIITATRELWLDRFPCGRQRIQIPKPPLQSIVSVQYVGSDGTLTSFDDGGTPATPLWQMKAPAGPTAARGWIEPTYGNEWPFARCESGAVRIQYTCGYGDASTDVPELVTGVLCLLIAHFDQYRGVAEGARTGQLMEVPFGIGQLIESFKLSALQTEPDPEPQTWWGYPWR